MAWSEIYRAVASVVINNVFVYLIGIQGATIATMISSYIIYSVRRKAAREEFQIRGYWRILLSWGLLCLQAAIEIYLSTWYIELIIILVLLHINWNMLIEAIPIL